MWDLTFHPPSRPSVLVGTRSLLQSMWDPPIHLLRGPSSLLAHRLMSTPFQGSASSLTHRPVFNSDTICNSPSLPLADIVLGLPLKVFKMPLLGRGFHTLINNASFSSPTDVGSHSINTFAKFQDVCLCSYMPLFLEGILFHQLQSVLHIHIVDA